MKIDDIPEDEVQKIRDRLIQQISSMDSSEVKIVAESEKSLADFIGSAFREIAGLAGYIIAIPIAYATRIAQEMYTGVKRGWDEAWENSGANLGNVTIIKCWQCGRSNRVPIEKVKKIKGIVKCGTCGNTIINSL